jgi:Mg2+ and Co2+ transporter CorA
MNVDLPGDESIAEFWLILATMAVILVGLLYFFRRRGYL